MLTDCSKVAENIGNNGPLATQHATGRELWSRLFEFYLDYRSQLVRCGLRKHDRDATYGLFEFQAVRHHHSVTKQLLNYLRPLAR